MYRGTVPPARDVVPAWVRIVPPAGGVPRGPPAWLSRALGALALVALVGGLIAGLLLLSGGPRSPDAATTACGTACGDQLMCSPAGTCVQCVDDVDCTGSVSGVCVGGTCRQGCTTSAACPAGAPKCAQGACVECTGNVDCGGGTPLCSAAGACVACIYAPTGTGIGCNRGRTCTPHGTCVSVCGTGNAGCAAPTPLCNATTLHCVACVVDTDCGAGQRCNAIGVCVACLSAGDCPLTSDGLPQCCTKTGTCAQVACAGLPNLSAEGKDRFMLSGIYGLNCAQGATSNSGSDIFWVPCDVSNPAQYWMYAPTTGGAATNGLHNSTLSTAWIVSPHDTSANPTPAKLGSASGAALELVAITPGTGFTIGYGTGNTAMYLQPGGAGSTLQWASGATPSTFVARYTDGRSCNCHS